ncbi:MAG: hypothetical protein K0R98_311 [Rickettsiaceae bacterium]|jgi:4-amino-4-deoxy-L-arabinose transferase-like glycosyltransferase|nr:hypothetical protein [Rickettsiaceae bacterium]
MGKISRTVSTKTTILILALITAFRILYLSLDQFDLFFDEAQYWIWSQNPALGYYSKPPMVAWMITLTTTIFGNSEWAVRLSSPILHMITAIAIYFASQELFKPGKRGTESIPFYCAITYITLPAVWVSSALVSTDPSLIMFWSLTILFFVKAIATNRMRWWILAGVAGGLGMLSKYNMLLVAVSIFLYLLSSKQHRKHLLSIRFWLAGVIAALIFTPNIIWNMQNSMVSFAHTEDNATGTGFGLHIPKMLEFVGAQFGVFGPILFATLLWVLCRSVTYFVKSAGKNNYQESYKLLILAVLPLFCMITAISFVSRAHANWAAPIYVPATMLVVAWLINNHHKNLVKISVALHISLAMIALAFPYLDRLPHVQFTGTKTAIEDGQLYIKDPFKRVRGWKDLGEGVTIAMQAYPDAKLLTDTRKVHAELLYYVHPHPFDAVKWNPTGRLADHFDLTTDINKSSAKNFLYITTSQTADKDKLNYFESAERVGNIEIKPYEDFATEYYVYYLVGFKGY